MGIRCNPGAVPAAVKSVLFRTGLFTITTETGVLGRGKDDKPENLPRQMRRKFIQSVPVVNGKFPAIPQDDINFTGFLIYEPNFSFGGKEHEKLFLRLPDCPLLWRNCIYFLPQPEFPKNGQR